MYIICGFVLKFRGPSSSGQVIVCSSAISNWTDMNGFYLSMHLTGGAADIHNSVTFYSLFSSINHRGMLLYISV